MGGGTARLMNPFTAPFEIFKQVKNMMKTPEVPQETEQEVKPTVVEDTSRAVEQEHLRQQRKRGRASTVLAGDYRSGAAKRLLGE